MKLLRVYTTSDYLVIETDEGPRKQSLKWDGVDRLQQKAKGLVGKEIVTTASGSWNPLVWFATLEEHRSLRALARAPDARHDVAQRSGTGEDHHPERALSAPPCSLDHVFKIYGPPGTGKTTLLLEKVREALEAGIQPSEIGFFSYTNKATEEAKKRMGEKFPQFEIHEDFPYFRTLHSLAVLSLRTRVAVITEAQAREFDPNVLVERPLMQEGKESSRVVRVKHPVLDASSTARAMKVPLRQYLSEMPHGQLWPINKWRGQQKRLWDWPLSEDDIRACVDYNGRYEDYKAALGVIDYTDMLERALKDPVGLPQLRLLLIDEAQDLNPLQWDLAGILIDRSELCYVAGDDDQAICESFGASARHFVELPVKPEHEIVLPESRRIPPVILAALDPLIGKLGERFPGRKHKSWKPRRGDHQGKVGGFRSIDELFASGVLRNAIESGKSVLVMFLTNTTLKNTSGLLRQKGVSHYAANELEGTGKPQVRLLTVWGAKGGEAQVTALVIQSDMDRKMLSDDPRLEYVAHTRASEEHYIVDPPA